MRTDQALRTRNQGPPYRMMRRIRRDRSGAPRNEPIRSNQHGAVVADPVGGGEFIGPDDMRVEVESVELARSRA